MTYTLVRSRKRRKTLSIQIGSGGAVLVRAPYRTPQREIEGFLAEKKQWLQQKIAREMERQGEKRQSAFRSGESFLFLGESFPLRVDEETSRPEALAFTGREFVLSGDARPGARALFFLWYRKKAQEYIPERVDHFSRALGMSPRVVAISRARCRWGSCSADNRLAFTWRMIMAPPAVIDYVVVHELGHMKIRNHSHDYWEFVESVLPDYKKRRDWLKEKGHLLAI
jgi:predicted metal-dependent hydrolase